jgi:hypothetical protein
MPCNWCLKQLHQDLGADQGGVQHTGDNQENHASNQAQLHLQMFARQASACPSISMCGLLRLQLRMNSSSAVTPPFSTMSWQQALL